MSPTPEPPPDPAALVGDHAPGPDGRDSWHTYFLRIAHLVASRGTCDRLQVGAVLVRDRRIVATGYNGAPSGVEHCSVAGHDLDAEQHCTRAVHAEVNALLQCAAAGVRVEGSTAYVTVLPCWRCYSALHQERVSRVVYAGDYRPDPRVLALKEKLGSHAPALERHALGAEAVVTRALPGGAVLRLTVTGASEADLSDAADALAAKLTGGPSA